MALGQILIGFEYGAGLTHLVDPEKRRRGQARCEANVSYTLYVNPEPCPVTCPKCKELLPQGGGEQGSFF